MKRPLKITLIAAGSLLGLVLVLLGVASAFLFSGERLAALVRNRLNRMESVDFTLERVDAVLFRTFPDVSVRIRNFGMRAVPDGDSLARADEVFGALDLRALLFRNELRVHRVTARGIYADADGLMRVFASADTPEADTAGFSLPELPFPLVDLPEFVLEDVHLRYAADGLRAEVRGASVRAALQAVSGRADARLRLDIPAADVALRDTVYCRDLPLSASLEAGMDLETGRVDIRAAELAADGLPVAVKGVFAPQGAGPGSSSGPGLATDLEITGSGWSLERLAARVPEAWADRLQGVHPKGELGLQVQAKGWLADASLPLLTGCLTLDGMHLEAPFLPAPLEDGAVRLSFRADLNEGGRTDVTVVSGSVRAADNILAFSGTLDDVLADPAFGVKLEAEADVAQALAWLQEFSGPSESGGPGMSGIRGTGHLDLELDAAGRLSQLTDGDYEAVRASGRVLLRSADLTYADTVSFRADRVSADLSLPGRGRNGTSGVPASAEAGVDLALSGAGLAMGRSLSAALPAADLQLRMNVLSKEWTGELLLDRAEVRSDTLAATAVAPKLSFALLPSERAGGQGRVHGRFAADSLAVSSGRMFSFAGGRTLLEGTVDRDTLACGLLAQWQPVFSLECADSRLTAGTFAEPVEIPSVSLSFAEDTLRLRQGSFAMAGSDFDLSGIVSNIAAALSGEGLPEARMDFVSGYTDVDRLLACFSGMGVPEEEGVPEETPEPSEAAEGDPFMVPEGINLTLNTRIGRAAAMGNVIENVRGEVTVRDGTAILRQLGFTSDAAKMQLTAMYRSPRRNHLFVGLDFHLMDIEIDQLIRMVPKVDSLVPMLKSFAGQAEFHLALESNLNARYELKKSTILGAASIEGRNLVVLDSETFDRIAELMNFRKSSRNVIDSLAVDMTVFRDEVDIYPFVVSMDDYKVILSGRHNLDMSFNYHLDCVSPIRLGLDVKGRLGDLKFKVGPTRYRNLFVPERRNDLQERTFRLMEMIGSSLKASVVPETEPEPDAEPEQQPEAER